MAKPSELQVIQGIIEGLVKNDITPLFDGPSIILIDKHGNKVIDMVIKDFLNELKLKKF